MEFLQNMLEIMQLKRKKDNIYHKTPKNFSWNPKFWLKSLLRWFKFRDISGELIVKEETNIDEVILIWVKGILVWLFNILITGTLLQLAILPFYNPGLKLVPFAIFSFGLLAYIVSTTWGGFIKGLREVATASRK